MPMYKLGWESEKGEYGLYHAQVFVCGKWRPMHVACRTHRQFTAKELKEIRKVIWLNTGKTVALEDVHFKIDW